MPNHITNTIKVKDMNKFRELAISVDKEGKEYVDFEKILPMPQDLKITSGTGSWNLDKYSFGMREEEQQLQDMLRPMLDKIYNDEITQSEYVKLAFKNLTTTMRKLFKADCPNLDKKMLKDRMTLRFQSYFNLKRYNDTDWYDWSINNWGTKWNAYDTFMNEDGATFDTAWSCPFEWLEALAEYMDFSFSYADEDIGSNFGIGKAVNGELISRNLSEDDLLDNLDKEYLALTIKGYDYDEHKDNQKTWYPDEDVDILPTDRQSILKNAVLEFI